MLVEQTEARKYFEDIRSHQAYIQQLLSSIYLSSSRRRLSVAQGQSVYNTHSFEENACLQNLMELQFASTYEKSYVRSIREKHN